jgi:hypothetical protein
MNRGPLPACASSPGANTPLRVGDGRAGDITTAVDQS